MKQPRSAIATRQSFAALRQFARQRAPTERCDLCSMALGEVHPHLVELTSRRMLCACEACAILFSGDATRYRRVPWRVELLRRFELDDAEWDSLALPINLAFFFHSTAAKRVVALYPSPAGATESLLPLDAWQELTRRNPVLRELEPDVEALLAHRLGATPEYYRAPIDVCYELVGLIRSTWTGLSGGEETSAAIRGFFARLKERCDA